MSDTVQGVVTNRSGRATGVQLDGEQQWYNAKPGVLADAEPGTEVRLHVNRKGDSVFVNSVEVLGQGQAPEKQSESQETSTASSKPKTAKQTAYEESQEARQRAIIYQSARNAAIEALKVAVSADTLALPTKKADRFDALQAFIDELTDQYYEAAMNNYKGE